MRTDVQKQIVSQLLSKKKYDGIREYLQVMFGQNDVVFESYDGLRPRLFKDEDEHIVMLLPNDMDTVMEGAVVDSIKDGTIFDDANVVNNTAKYIRMTTLPYNGLMNKNIDEPKALVSAVGSVVGTMNDEGRFGSEDSDLENGVNAMRDLMDHSNDEPGAPIKLVANYIDLKKNGEIPRSYRRSLAKIGDEVEDVKKVDIDDTVNGSDYNDLELTDECGSACAPVEEDAGNISGDEDYDDETEVKPRKEDAGNLTGEDDYDEDDDKVNSIKEEDDVTGGTDTNATSDTSTSSTTTDTSATSASSDTTPEEVESSYSDNGTDNADVQQEGYRLSSNRSLHQFPPVSKWEKYINDHKYDDSGDNSIYAWFKLAYDNMEKFDFALTSIDRREFRKDMSNIRRMINGKPEIKSQIDPEYTYALVNRKDEFEALKMTLDFEVYKLEDVGKKVPAIKSEFGYFINSCKKLSKAISELLSAFNKLSNNKLDGEVFKNFMKTFTSTLKVHKLYLNRFKSSHAFASHPYKEDRGADTQRFYERERDELNEKAMKSKNPFKRAAMNVRSFMRSNLDDPGVLAVEFNIDIEDAEWLINEYGTYDLMDNTVLQESSKTQSGWNAIEGYLGFDLPGDFKNGIDNAHADWKKFINSTYVENGHNYDISEFKSVSSIYRDITGDNDGLPSRNALSFAMDGYGNQFVLAHGKSKSSGKEEFRYGFYNHEKHKIEFFKCKTWKEFQNGLKLDDDTVQEGFFTRKPKRLKPIPRDTIAYITIELNAIKDSNDQAMLAGYTCSKLELVDFYLNCIDTQDDRYIVPHSRQYLVQMQNELNALLTRILQIRPMNKMDRIWKPGVTLPDTTWR